MSRHSAGQRTGACWFRAHPINSRLWNNFSFFHQLSGGGDMKCSNAFGHTVGSVAPKSCLASSTPSPAHGPSPSPSHPPKPSPSPSPSPTGCNVTACFQRCINKYGGTVTTVCPWIFIHLGMGMSLTALPHCFFCWIMCL